MERGIDHTGVLAGHAGARAGVRVVRGLARRHTPTQVGLSATARAANMRGVFRVRKCLARATGAIDGAGVRAVVVLDDVRTTGATMTAACRSVRSLLGSSMEVWALTAVVATERRGPGAGDAGLGGGPGREHEKIAKSFASAV
jgi:predicted amidophosphoribosyltransferase